MEIRVKRLWTELKIVLTTLIKIARKSPFIILTNPLVRVLYDGRGRVGHLIMLRRKKFSILKNIYIRPEYRDRGAARQLIEDGLRHYKPPCYLICLPHLQAFYEKLGFELAQKVPAEVGFHVLFGAFRSVVFGGQKVLAMVYDPLKTDQESSY